MPFRSIGARVQLIAGAAFVCGLAGVLAYQTYNRIEATRAERRDANFRIVHGLSGPASGAIALRDGRVIRSYMELLSSDPRAAGVVIATGNKVFDSQQSIEHLDLPLTKLAAQALKAESSGKVEIADDGDFEFIAVPVNDRAMHTAGSIAVAWSIKGLLDNVWLAAAREAVALAGVALLVLLLLLGTLRRFVTGPITSIARQVELSATNPSADAEAASPYEGRSDEIGIFARALGRFYRNAAEKSVLYGQFESALSNMSQGLCMFDRDDRLVVSNARLAEIYGLPDGILKPGMSLTETVAAMLAGGLLPGDALVFDAKRQLSLVGGGETGTRTHELRNGRTITVTRQPKADGGWVATHSDVTELHHVEKQLSHLVNHDALTGLCNRRRFHEVLGEVMKDDARRQNAAVMFLDLDRFKNVNDTFGHAAGDALLKTVADRLLACVRQHDVVCRVGGDEFAILQLHAAQPEGAESLAQRLTRSLAQPIAIGDELASIGVSTGIAIAPQDGEDAETLLHHADLAVYLAKNEGRNVHRFYEAGMGRKPAGSANPGKRSA